ncbi:apolipoprotein D-like [Bombus impatiens]|uniref:Apolipoprotein D-like n=1 Tax=Bombus impatiens TaxID=132113 RepID=A0A6P6FB03_BOMIM|nr:apolipoprotein D-like [Bombus impatiens]XP_024222538.1 apolipoprotein D-like [Bombus impatiens]
MIGKIVLILSALALVRAQIPSLGFCPDYVPMANFDMSKFLGIWYEAERYFQLTEVVSRCVMANYTMGPDGKYRVSNEVTNRFTGIKRVLEGEIKKAASKAEEGKLIVKYTIPLTPETKYSVLETDYDSYAVLWSCSGIGPFHTQNAWVMTRERLAPGTVLQKAYAVLDSYKISKTFFVKTDQQDCAYLDTPKPLETSEIQGDQAPVEAPQKDTENVRAAIVPDAPEVIVEMNTKEDEKLTKKSQTAENAKKKAVNTVPVRIMEVADAVKEDIPTKNAKIKEEKNDEPMKEGVDENMKQVEKIA